MRRTKTRDGLIRAALDEIAKTERPVGVSMSPGVLQEVDRLNREKRKAILEQLLQDALFA